MYTKLLNAISAVSLITYSAFGHDTGQSIGLNFGADEPPGVGSPLAAGTKAGVVPQANWNNLNGANGASGSVLRDFYGTPIGSSISVTWSCPNTWSSTGRGEENNAFPDGGDRALMTGYLDTDDAAGVATVTVSGLGPEFTAEGYDIIVYALGGVAGRGGAYRIGSMTKFGTGPAGPSTYIEDPGADHNDTGNYMRFSNLNGPSFTLVADASAAVGFGATRRAPINGVQIISRAQLQLTNLFAPGDPIVLVNGVNDGDNDAGPPPAAETVDHAIDRFTQKYLNFLDLGSGFAATPQAGPTIAQAIRFYTANDAEPRDPASYLLEGSTAGLNGPWTTIASGPLSLPSGRNGGGSTPIDPAVHVNQTVQIANSSPYTSYRITFPTLKDAASANSMQIAEVELLGVLFPGPAKLVQQPMDQTVVEGHTASFSAAADGSPPFTFQWFVKKAGDADFNAIPGANTPSYTTPAAVFPDDDNAQFRVRVSNDFGSADSRVAVLRVLDDNTPPLPVSAAGSPTFDQISVQFDEEVEESGAEDPFSYEVSGGLSIELATLSADARSVVLKLVAGSLQTENTEYIVTVKNIADLAGNVRDLATVSFRSWVAGCGGLLFETYNTGTGTAVSQLTGHATFPDNPDSVRTISSFDTRAELGTDNFRDNYGARLRGVLIPPVSGSYDFYMHNDDGGHFYINPNGADPAGKQLAAILDPACCQDWPAINSLGMFPNGISLEAGRAYYIEGLYKEQGGGDYIRVAARLHGSSEPLMAIPSAWLGQFAPAGAAGGITVVQPPTDITVEECRTATFAVSAQHEDSAFSFLPLCYQWKLNGVDIPGATGRSYTTPTLSLANDGEVYSVEMSIIGARVLSAEATLHVTDDTTPANCVKAMGTRNLNNVVLVFSEIMDQASAEDTFGYSVPGFQVMGAVLDSSGTQVTLTLDAPLTPGGSYSVTASGTKDCNGNELSSCTANFNAWIMGEGFALREIYLGIGGGVLIPDLTGNPVYPDSPSLVDYSPLLEGPLDRYDNYGIRISGHLTPPVSGNYNFFISSDDAGEFWLSTDASPANLQKLCLEPQWNASRAWLATDRRNAAAPENRSTTLFPDGIPLVAGQPYYFEALMKEGGGGDNLGVAWQLPGGPVPENGASPISGHVLSSLVDPEGAVVSITQQPQDVTVQECTTATFTTADAGSILGNPNPPRSYRWQKNTGAGFADILDAPNAPSLTQFVTKADDGAQYRVIVYVPGANVTSEAATLTVTDDTVPPQIVSAARSASEATKVSVQFNELMDAALLADPSKYSIDQGISVLSAAAGTDGQSVVLTTSPGLSDGVCYRLTANVTDCGGVPVTPAVGEIGLEQPRREVDGLLVVEAENFDSNTPGSGSSPESWQLLTDKGGYSGAGAMGAFPDDGGTSPSPTQLGQAAQMQYTIVFQQIGTHYIWIRGASGPGGGGSDSLHYGINGAHGGALTGIGGAFGWARNIQGGLGRNNFEVTSPGVHTLNIWMREDGTYLDKILITTSSSFTPTGLGPNESPRGTPYPLPVVQVTDPGAPIEACADVTITADAAVDCGHIVSVEFFANGASLGSDNEAPYSITVPGAAVQPGAYVLTAKAMDNHGGTANSAPVSVSVLDSTGPVLACPVGVTGQCGQPVLYDVSGTDACDGPVAVTCVPPSGTVLPLGSTSVTCTGADAAGNSSSCSFPVNVVDTVPPQIVCPADILVSTSNPDGEIVTWTLEAADSCSAVQRGCEPMRGSRFPLGTTEVNCFAQDEAGNRSTCSFKVTVNGTPICDLQPKPESCGVVFPDDGNYYVITLNDANACVALDGSGSSDPDGDPLSYRWMLNNVFPVSLDPGQEPNGGGTGSGTGAVQLAGDTLTLSIAFSGLSANATAAHIHGPAVRGVNAGVLYPLVAITTLGATEGVIHGSVTLEEGKGGFTIAQQLEQLFGGQWYINIHTPNHTGGEIRGQIDPGQSDGPVMTQCLDLGCYLATLTVSDGKVPSRCEQRICVITAGEAVQQCVQLIENSDLGRQNKRPLIASLKAAIASFDRGSWESAMGQLGAFQNKVQAQIGHTNPAETAAFIESAQRVLDALNCAAAQALANGGQ